MLSVDESSLSKTILNEVAASGAHRDVLEVEESIYKLLFKLPSVPSKISPSVVSKSNGCTSS